MGVKFYHFDHPEYDTDYAHSYLNPIEVVHEISVPAIKCDVCGEHLILIPKSGG